MLPTGREMAARAWKMGLKIVAGTDTSYFDKNNRTLADEMIELSDAGLGPMDAIKAGTPYRRKSWASTSAPALFARATRRILW